MPGLAVGKTACSLAQPRQHRPRVEISLEILTLNLWGTNGPAYERMANLVAYLREAPPDVVALQEVEGWDGTTQAHHLAREAGYTSVSVVRTGRWLRRGEGLAVLANREAHLVDMVALDSTLRDHPRGVQLVDVPAFDGVVRVANTHLAWRLDATEQRVEQVTGIRDELAGWTGPAVVAGDLNDVAGSSPLDVLTAAGFADALAAAGGRDRPTFDRANPYLWQPELADRRVDHVLVHGLEATAAQVVLTGEDAPIVSDHFGLRITLAPAGVR